MEFQNAMVSIQFSHPNIPPKAEKNFYSKRPFPTSLFLVMFFSKWMEIAALLCSRRE